MLQRLVMAAIAILLIVTSPTAYASTHHQALVQASGDVAMFQTEGAALAHCPTDTVVWLNTRSGIFHEKGMRWYGRTKQGAYVCRKEATAAGYRDTRNGQ